MFLLINRTSNRQQALKTRSLFSSLKVGYDEGQKMSERLTRHNTRIAGTAKSPSTQRNSAAAAAATSAQEGSHLSSAGSRRRDDRTRQHIINTVQLGDQARVTRSSAAGKT
jgi:hypothetical protein